MTIAVNSFGFTGTLGSKNEEDLELIRKYTPLGILTALCVPMDGKVPYIEEIEQEQKEKVAEEKKEVAEEKKEDDIF